MGSKFYRNWDVRLKETIVFTDADGKRVEARTVNVKAEKIEVSPHGDMLFFCRNELDLLVVKTVISSGIWWMVHDGGECDSDDE